MRFTDLCVSPGLRAPAPLSSVWLFLALTTKHQQLALPPVLPPPATWLLSSPSTRPSFKQRPQEDPAEDSLLSVKTYLQSSRSPFIRVFFLLHPFLKLGETPLFFCNSASHTEYIWSEFFLLSFTPNPEWKLLLCFENGVKSYVL